MSACSDDLHRRPIGTRRRRQHRRPGRHAGAARTGFQEPRCLLKSRWGDLGDVVKTNTFVTDYPAFSQCSGVRMRYFAVGSPTSTTIQISGLAQPEAMVEIEMIAAVD